MRLLRLGVALHFSGEVCIRMCRHRILYCASSVCLQSGECKSVKVLGADWRRARMVGAQTLEGTGAQASQLHPALV